ncbi:MAG: tetratricopeptide repeat protein [Melioribacteraceae bacterium]|nr:tetratricopeptide repeat protein [Melioribacteraceae bacterium]
MIHKTDTIRILAAIMFTDMQGYTSLMQKNESEAKKNRDIQRKILDEEITAHKGQILQFYGDGTLSVFGSAVEAVNCAIHIQQRLKTEIIIPLRIGIHMGDVIYDDSGVLGDGVNIASRIESLSVAGGILISEKINDEIINHPEISSRSLGRVKLKNVARPIEIFAITNSSINVPSEYEFNKRSGNLNSIAVLPFINMSNDPENEYFSDGISEEILNLLAKQNNLRVISRTSSFSYKGKNIDIRQIGNELNATAVLEGSVRKMGNRVRVTAQLINSENGFHIWSDNFDHSLDNIFEVQDQIAEKITQVLCEKLDTSKPIKDKSPKRFKSLDAYNKYLKGVYYWNKWTPEYILKAVDCFKEAIKLEPDSPLPYADLSECYIYLGAMGLRHPKEYYPLAKTAAEKALELNSELSDSQLAMGMVKIFFEWDWSGAEFRFKKAMELNPNSADVYHYYTYYLLAIRDLPKAQTYAEKAHELDPLSLPIISFLASVYYEMGKFDESLNLYHHCIELDPEFRNAYSGLGWTYWVKGDLESAIKYFKLAQKKTSDPKRGITPLAYVYGKTGKTEEAKDLLNKLLEREKEDSTSLLHMDIAIVYFGLNEFDKAFERLELAVKERLGGVFFLTSSLWNDYRNDPRFQKILNSVGVVK